MDSIGLSLVKELELETELKKEEAKLLMHFEERELEIFRKYRVMVCGGAITSIFSNREINDIDCYFRTKEDFEECHKELKQTYSKFVCKTKNAVTLTSQRGKHFQLICLEDYFQDTPEKIYSQFDFTICFGAYDFANGSFSVSNNFLKHLAQRVLVYNVKAKNPINSFLRVNKFNQRGFTISKVETFKIIVSLTALKINTYGDLLDSLGAVSSATSGKLTSKIEDKNLTSAPFTMESFLELLEESEEEINAELCHATSSRHLTSPGKPVTHGTSIYSMGVSMAKTSSASAKIISSLEDELPF